MSPSIDKEPLLDDIPDGIAFCTAEGNIQRANNAFASALGLPLDRILNRNFTEFAERGIEWRALISLLEQGGIVQDYEMKFKKGDGTPICASLSACFLRDETGTLTGIAVAFRDISTRKGIENELREKSFRIDVINKIARLMSVEKDVREHALGQAVQELKKMINFDVMTVGLWVETGRHVEVIFPGANSTENRLPPAIVPFEGSLVEQLRFGRNAVLVGKEAWNKPFSELSVMELKGMSSLLAVPLTSRGRIYGSLNLLHAKPNEYTLESAEVLKTVADQVAGLIDNMLLVDTLQAKIKLQEILVKTGMELQRAIDTKQIYAAIATNIREVVEYTELSFYLVDWTKNAVYPVYALGPWVDEVMAAPGTMDEGVVGVVAKTGRAELVDDVDADPRSSPVPGAPVEHNAMLALPLTGPEGVMGVLELYRPAGRVFSMGDLESGKMFAQQASVALFNYHLVSRLQEAKKEIELLNDLMFHDINNFNFATLNYIQIVAALPQLPGEHKVYLEKSLHLIRQTADLIENVKKLTKIGVMDPNEFTSIDLVPILRKVASGIETAFPGKPVSVTMSLPQAAPIKANSLVEELFINLLSNSVKYDPHETVEIEVKCERVVDEGRTFWRIAVSDHGNGVADEKKGQLFQKYVRLKPDSDISGTGLGLSICRALSDKFGGRVWVEDRVHGKSELGAVFFVQLPAAKEKHQ